MKSIKAMNRLITQVTLIVFAIVGLLLVFPPMADAGNRLVARSCDHGTVAAIVAPTYAYTAPSTCNQNAPLQQRELGDATVDQCPQAAAAIAYPEVQRYTLVPQVSRYAQVQRVQSPYAQKVLFLNDGHHHHHNNQQFRQVQRLQNQAHHHNQQAIRQNQRLQNQAHHHHTAQFRLAQNGGNRKTVTKTVTRSSRR